MSAAAKRYRCIECDFTFKTVGCPIHCPQCGKFLSGCNECTATIRLCQTKQDCINIAKYAYLKEPQI